MVLMYSPIHLYIMKRILTMILAGMIFFKSEARQNELSFSSPQTVSQNALSDMAPSIIATKNSDHYLITWKQIAPSETISIADLEVKENAVTVGASYSVENAGALGNPELIAFNNTTYLFWINHASQLNYATVQEGKVGNVQAVPLNASTNGTFDIETLDDELIFTLTDPSTNNILYSKLKLENEHFTMDALQQVDKKAKTEGYATLLSKGNAMHLIWSTPGKKKINFSEYDSGKEGWAPLKELSGQHSSISPSGFNLSEEQLLYIWKGFKADQQLYYAYGDKENRTSLPIPLPPYLSTNNNVEIAAFKKGKYLMVYTDLDNKVKICQFTEYNPERWMADVLFPMMENKTLKDIVIPGSHDAGMSVLNGVGGKKSGTINECNTLTQSHNIENQLKQGLRMFDFRVGPYNNQLYLKHSSSDCMDDAIGGGYGEKLSEVLIATKTFIEKNKDEFVIFTFSHFCPRELTPNDLAKFLVENLGSGNILDARNKKLGEIKLKDIKGKVLLMFENIAIDDYPILSNTMIESSDASLNIKRLYAATNNLQKLCDAESAFFNALKSSQRENDWIRLDWQLTQSPEEAATICNDFQKPGSNPLMDGAILLSNVVSKNKSIIDLAKTGNDVLPSKVNEWIKGGVIDEKNKPNIIYVDNAGSWITNFCVELNRTQLYNK